MKFSPLTFCHNILCLYLEENCVYMPDIYFHMKYQQTDVHITTAALVCRRFNKVSSISLNISHPSGPSLQQTSRRVQIKCIIAPISLSCLPPSLHFPLYPPPPLLHPSLLPILQILKDGKKRRKIEEKRTKEMFKYIIVPLELDQL